MQTINSFPPIISKSCRILILGSIPGIESLRQNQYYANSRNLFWKIIYAVFDKEPDPSYNKRIEFLLSKHIALWDVIDNCTREGSLDSSIKNEKTNDFITLFREYPDITNILFNGTKAYNSFIKKVKLHNKDNFIYKKLPSTSPAHTLKYEDKLKEWMIIKKLIL